MGDVVELRPPAPAGPPTERWKAVVTYRSEKGPSVREHFFEEIVELDDLIELGPNWNTMVDCVITVNRRSEEIPRLTVEQAEIL